MGARMKGSARQGPPACASCLIHSTKQAPSQDACHFGSHSVEWGAAPRARAFGRYRVANTGGRSPASSGFRSRKCRGCCASAARCGRLRRRLRCARSGGDRPPIRRRRAARHLLIRGLGGGPERTVRCGTVGGVEGAGPRASLAGARQQQPARIRNHEGPHLRPTQGRLGADRRAGRQMGEPPFPPPARLKLSCSHRTAPALRDPSRAAEVTNVLGCLGVGRWAICRTTRRRRTPARRDMSCSAQYRYPRTLCR